VWLSHTLSHNNTTTTHTQQQQIRTSGPDEEGKDIEIPGVDVPDGRGNTPLHWAVRNGRTEVVQWLLDQDSVDVEAIGYGGFRPIHHAANMIREREMAILLEKGADPDSADQAGNTPLHFAVSRGVLKPIMFLVDAGADINARNGQGWTPLHKACAVRSHCRVNDEREREREKKKRDREREKERETKREREREREIGRIRVYDIRSHNTNYLN
jgi:hypothetical protein